MTLNMIASSDSTISVNLFYSNNIKPDETFVLPLDSVVTIQDVVLEIQKKLISSGLKERGLTYSLVMRPPQGTNFPPLMVANKLLQHLSEDLPVGDNRELNIYLFKVSPMNVRTQAFKLMLRAQAPELLKAGATVTPERLTKKEMYMPGDYVSINLQGKSIHGKVIGIASYEIDAAGVGECCGAVPTVKIASNNINGLVALLIHLYYSNSDRPDEIFEVPLTRKIQTISDVKDAVRKRLLATGFKAKRLSYNEVAKGSIIVSDRLKLFQRSDSPIADNRELNVYMGKISPEDLFLVSPVARPSSAAMVSQVTRQVQQSERLIKKDLYEPGDYVAVHDGGVITHGTIVKIHEYVVVAEEFGEQSQKTTLTVSSNDIQGSVPH